MVGDAAIRHWINGAAVLPDGTVAFWTAGGLSLWKNEKGREIDIDSECVVRGVFGVDNDIFVVQERPGHGKDRLSLKTVERQETASIPRNNRVMRVLDIVNTKKGVCAVVEVEFERDGRIVVVSLSELCGRMVVFEKLFEEKTAPRPRKYYIDDMNGHTAYVGETRHGTLAWVIDCRPHVAMDDVTRPFFSQEHNCWCYWGRVGQHLALMKFPF